MEQSHRNSVAKLEGVLSMPSKLVQLFFPQLPLDQDQWMFEILRNWYSH